MSMQSLLAEDSITVMRPIVQKDLSGGAVREKYQRLFPNVAARVNVLGSAQVLAWAQMEIEANYEVQTEQEGIKNGDLILCSDERILRVTGIKKRIRMGGLDGYHVYPCLEMKGVPVHLMEN